MITEAAGAGQFEMPGLDGYDSKVPRIQIVTVQQAMALRDRAVRLPAMRLASHKKASREEDQSRQKALDL